MFRKYWIYKFRYYNMFFLEPFLLNVTCNVAAFWDPIAYLILGAVLASRC